MVFTADVPGLKKEEVKVEVEEGNVLQISVERNREKEEKNDTWHRVERSSGKFLAVVENARDLDMGRQGREERVDVRIRRKLC
ncbi:hypothetical protein ACS0TY_028078 [Phlomoides rotata]